MLCFTCDCAVYFCVMLLCVFMCYCVVYSCVMLLCVFLCNIVLCVSVCYVISCIAVLCISLCYHYLCMCVYTSHCNFPITLTRNPNTNHPLRLCAELKEITERALSTPGDTLELMAHKSYMENVMENQLNTLETRVWRLHTQLQVREGGCGRK